MAKRWYVVHAYSGYENKVKVSLVDYVERAELGEFFGEILVPSEEVVEIRDGKKRTSERKFFPGYVLVNMEMNEDTWHLVKSVPQVMGFIGGTKDRPAPVSQKEVDRILERVETSVDKPRPKVMYEPGEMVRVTEGPFTDFEAVLERVDYDRNKLQVSVLIFGRSTPVDLEFTQVEKI
ncbi:MAG: transcription termination/antitermination protein NusG [Thiomicrorhabdus sp.]|jgi:transcriptional antiterminator NusG|nr:transcription termination/antitermination protein NusG [Thiomicrorhabdus sp.]